jgi:hypothetical protein
MDILFCARCSQSGCFWIHSIKWLAVSFKKGRKLQKKVYDESDDVEGVNHRINESLPGMNRGCEPRDIFKADETAHVLFTDARQDLDTEK